MALPLYLTGMYQDKHYNAGIPGSPTVFDALVNPPESGVEAQEVVEQEAKDVGVIDADTDALLDRTRQRDHFRDRYDSQSILRVQE